MAASANLVKVGDSRMGGDTVIPEDDSAQLPLRSECEFEKWTVKCQTYLHADLSIDRLGDVVVQEIE